MPVRKQSIGAFALDGRSNIKCIDLRGKKLCDRDCKKIMLDIKSKFDRIDLLDLGNNYLSTKGLKTILKHMQKTPVSEIRMDKNNLNTKAILYLNSFTKHNRHLRNFVFGAIDSYQLTSELQQHLNVLKSRGLVVEFTNI